MAAVESIRQVLAELSTKQLLLRCDAILSAVPSELESSMVEAAYLEACRRRSSEVCDGLFDLLATMERNALERRLLALRSLSVQPDATALPVEKRSHEGFDLNDEAIEAIVNHEAIEALMNDEGFEALVKQMSLADDHDSERHSVDASLGDVGGTAGEQLPVDMTDHADLTGWEWPDVDVSLTSGNGSEIAGLPPAGVLRLAGYKVGKSGLHDGKDRLRILKAVLLFDFPRALCASLPEDYLEEWGQPQTSKRLKKMADSLAQWIINGRKKQQNGQDYSTAIMHWRMDLHYLKRRFYDPLREAGFTWPDDGQPDQISSLEEPVADPDQDSTVSIEKSIGDLRFVPRSEDMPHIEVDLYSLENEGEYVDHVAKSLLRLASDHFDPLVTVYACASASVNFGNTPTASIFLGMAAVGVEADRVQQALLGAFRSLPGVRVRISEPVAAGWSQRSIHLQDRRVWVPLDVQTWCSPAHLMSGRGREGTA